MNLGTIKARIRILNGSTTPTRWSEQYLTNLINMSQQQLAMEVDFPTATWSFQNVQPPAQPTVTPEGTPGSTAVSYAIVAVGATGGGDSAPSPTVTIQNANATLSDTNYNAISWASAPGVTYKVLRQYVGTQPFVQLLATVTATGTTTTVNDQGQYNAAVSAYLIQRGNEIQIPEVVKFLRVYLLDQAGDMQPLVPYDISTLAGIMTEQWDQSSGQTLGYPQFTPQFLAQTEQPFPIQSPIGQRVAVSQSWQNVMWGTQPPGYYLRGGTSGGYLGVLPPPNGLYTVVMDVLPKPATLQQNSDLSYFPDGFLDAICWRTLEYMAISDENSRDADFNARFTAEVKKLRIVYVDTVQGDKPHALVPMPLRTQMREWPT